MEKEYVMTVSVCCETVNIMTFNIQREDTGKITKIILCSVMTSNFQDAIEDIKMASLTSYGSSPIMACLIDTMSCGIDIFRRLNLEKDFTVPIYETERRIARVVSNSIVCLRDFLETDFVEVKQDGLEKNNLLSVLNNCKTKSNGLLISNSDNDLTFDIAFMVNNILTYKEDMIKDNRNNRIKNNLLEVINILIEELNEIDKNDTSKLENLLKMIDKINYVKGQIL